MADLQRPPVLEFEHISKSFGGAEALKDVSLDIGQGEIHGLVGENGAGKSTLVKILAGVHIDYDGTLKMNGRVVRFNSPADARAAGIGMVYQELSLFRSLSVTENIFLTDQPTRGGGFVDWQRMHRLAREHLAELHLDIPVTAEVGDLTVGQQQMVEIARVLFSGASIILLDEPTSALSPPEAERLFEFMLRLKAQGTTIVLITHFLEDVLRVCDRVTVLKNGRKVATLDNQGLTKHQLIELMIGKDAQILQRAYEEGAALHEDQVGPVVLEARGLTREPAFRNVSFTVRAGEILGIYGYMGAGKTELANCLFGVDPLDRGELRIDGRPVRIRSATDAKRAGMAYVPENRRSALVLGQPIYKNISLPHLDRLARIFLNVRRELGVAEEQVRRLGVRPPDPALPVGALSGGNQQKVVLGKWLTHPPRLLILAEPTRGMDVGAKDEVLRIVQGLRRQGVAIILVSSEPETVIANSDRIIVLARGNVTKEFHDEVVTKDQLMRYA